MSDLERLAVALVALRQAALTASDAEPRSSVARFGDRLADLLAAGDRLFDELIGDSPIPTGDAVCGLTIH